MKGWLPQLALLGFALFLLPLNHSAADAGVDQGALASKLILPRVEFAGVSPVQIFRQLERMSKQRDPARQGVRFVLEEPLPPSASKVSLTFTMNDTSLLNIAKHVANMAEITVEPRKDGVYVMPAKKP